MGISKNIWQVRMWKPGMWEQNNPLREIIRQMEKINSIKTVFEPGVCVPGLDTYECPLQEIIKQMEKQ